ncbi:MAG: GNAT family N-acetyltransferase [Ruminococcus sp.]|nr:GNAT family N-acetyltransferase [Ruminococcus sp.]
MIFLTIISDREQFIKDNQEAFNYGAMEEFGLRDAHFEDKADGQIISHKTIEACIDTGEAYRIIADDKIVGGAVIKVSGSHGDLELLFIKPEVHSKGIGYAAWCEIENPHPEVTVWETFTPCFETRNIHFYVNRCGFHIVEYLNKHHTGDFPADAFENDDAQFPAGMFRFKKQMK